MVLAGHDGPCKINIPSLRYKTKEDRGLWRGQEMKVKVGGELKKAMFIESIFKWITDEKIEVEWHYLTCPGGLS